MYLEENLKLTPQNLSDKAVALDELQEMHQQVCTEGSVLNMVLVREKSSNPYYLTFSFWTSSHIDFFPIAWIDNKLQ